MELISLEYYYLNGQVSNHNLTEKDILLYLKRELWHKNYRINIHLKNGKIIQFDNCRHIDLIKWFESALRVFGVIKLKITEIGVTKLPNTMQAVNT